MTATSDERTGTLSSTLSSSFVARSLPIAIADLKYEVGKGKTHKQILKGIDCVFEAGHMTALMGPSGCGKTTLMDVIAARKNTGTTKGSIMFDGAPCATKHLMHLCGYVEQFDNLVQELNVEEMLMYTAELKLPAFTKAERVQRVEESISALNLNNCRQTVIGGELVRGISGGQLKRTNIGLSLITRPPILFLDEPTSGLDSFMGHEICLILAQLAKEGRTIVATIHSPTARSFALFDDLLMLRDGMMTYSGPSNADVEKYFVSTLSVPPLTVGESLPEWLITLTCAPATAEEAEAEAAAAEAGKVPEATLRIAELYKESQAYANLREAARKNGVEGGGKPLTVSSSLHRANPLKAVWILLSYRAGKDYKNPNFLGPRVGDKVVFSLVVMSMYWGEGSKSDPQAIQSIAGVLFMVTALCGYGAASVVPTLVLDRPLFYREINDGCYGALSYYAYKIIQESFITMFTSLFFILVIFWAVELQGNFGALCFIYYLITMISIALAYACASLSPNMDAASALLPTYVTIAMFGGGLIMTISTMPPWWSWFHWTSFIRYGWAAMMNNHFSGSSTGEVEFIVGEDGELMNIMEFYSITGSFLGTTGTCVGMLVACLTFFLTCGGLAIKNVRFESR